MIVRAVDIVTHRSILCLWRMLPVSVCHQPQIAFLRCQNSPVRLFLPTESSAFHLRLISSQIAGQLPSFPGDGCFQHIPGYNLHALVESDDTRVTCTG